MRDKHLRGSILLGASYGFIAIVFGGQVIPSFGAGLLLVSSRQVSRWLNPNPAD